MARNNYQAGIVITGDASGGIRAIQKTGKELNELEQRFQRSASQSKRFGADVTQAGRQLHHIDDGAVAAGRGLDVLRTNVAGIAAAMATAFGAGSIISQAGVIADMDALAKSIGMGTTELQAWDYAAQQVKLSGGAIGDILKDVAERIGEFSAEGTGEAAALFENLNLEIKELRNLSPDQQLLKIGEAISGLGRGEQISYLERLGNDATRLLPLLENNAEGLRALTTEARSLGVAMDQVDIDNAIQADRAMAKLTGTMDGFKNQLAADLGPGLATAVSGLTDFIQEAGGAAAVLDDVKDVAMLTATVIAGRYAGAFASSALSIATHTAATVAQTQADVTATTAARAKTAETLRVAVSEQAAAKRAYENARATAAATGNTTLRTKAITQLAAANQRAIGAEAAHTAAVNTNSAAMARGTVAAQGMAAASRAGAGALALVGGPLGAAMLAGGAIYYFREELGLVQPEIEASADRVAELTGSLDAMSRAVVQNRIADLTADLQTLKTSFIEVTEVGTAADSGMISGSGVLGIAAGELGRQARAIQSAQDGMVQGIHSPETLAEIKAHEEALANLETQYESLGASAITVPPILRNNDEASKSAAKAAEQQANSLQALQQEMDPLLKDYETYLSRLETLDKALADGTITEERYVTALRWSAEQYKRAATGAEDYEKELKALVGQYDRQRQKAQQLATDEQAIQRAFDTNAISAEQYARMMGEVKEAQYRLALESETTFAAMATAWDRSVERMDDAGKDFWRGWLDGTGDAVDQFKNIVMDGVAEVAHALITRPLTVGLTADLQGMLGLGAGNQQSGGGLDFSNTLSAGRNLWKAGSSLFGGGAAASGSLAMQGGLSSAALASASQVASGAAYSGALGSAASGAALGNAATASSGFMSAASTAMPWIGAGMLVDEVLGLGIVDGIVSGISGLFGSSPTPFSGRFGTRESTTPGTFEHQDSTSERFYAESALGSVGFIDDGTERLQRAGTGSKAWAEELASGAAQIDNLVASLAQTTPELEAMRNTVQGLETSSKTAADIVDFALNTRPRAALEQIGGAFGEFVNSIEGGIEQVVQQAQIGQQAHALLSGSMERLNLQFDASTAGSYAAAGALADYVGGVERLSAINDGYYQSAFSETERLSTAQQDLLQSLSDITGEAPRTVAELRTLVEAQSQNGEASQRLAYDLMALAPALKETNAAVRQAIEQAYQNELGRAPESDELDYWFNQVASGALSLEGALQSVSTSIEAAIRDVYQSQLGREADAAGVSYWKGLVESGVLTLDEAFFHIATSTEALGSAAGGAADEIADAADALRDARSGVNSAFGDLRTLVQNEQRAISDAHNARIQGINAEMQAVQSGISETESLANTLHSALNSMQSDTLVSQQMQRQQAQAQVSTALAMARMTGTVSMSRELEEALRVVSEPSESLFGSFRDYQRDFYRTANEIAALESLTDEQLTTGELQLTEMQRQRDQWERQHNAEIERYDRMISSAETQVNTLLGIGASVDNIPAALDALEAAMRGYSNAGGGSTGGSGGGSAGGADVERTIRAAYSKILQRSISDADIEYWSGVGLTGDDLARAIAHTGYQEGSQHARTWWDQYGDMDDLPGFKNGGISDGPMSGYPVLHHGREAVIPLENGPIPLEIRGGDSGSNPMLQELQRQTKKLEAMEEELSELRSINVAIVEHNAKLAREAERSRRKSEMEGG